MTGKRFTNHIIKEDVDGTLHSDGILDAEEDNKIVIWNYFYIADLLNELNNENTHIKQTIQDMINTERTAIGKSVLKQLMEAIQ